MRTFLLMALLLLPGAMAAEITGTAYTESLDVARYALLSVNTTPPQRLLLSEGTYNLTAPPGTYLLRAAFRDDGITYEDELLITVVDDGTYTYDLILFRAEEGEEELPDVEALTFPEEAGRSWKPAAAILLLAAAIGAGAYLWRRRPGPRIASADTALPDDLTQVLALLRAEGGRATQKELRRHLPYSESKISMLITELEAKGAVQKIRKGRSNIIVLK